MRRQAEGRELGALARRLAGKKVAVIGDVVLDEYVYGQTDRISREAPVLIVREEKREAKPGAAANAAANLAALGAHAIAVGLTGDDGEADSLDSLCDGLGIDARFVRVPGTATERKIRILAGGINTRRQQMLRLDRTTAGAGPPPDGARRLLAEVRRAIEGAEAVVVSDYSGAVLGEGIRAEVLRAARAGTPVCVDSRYNLGAYHGATVAKPNEPELGATTGLPVGTPEDTLRAARALQKQLGCQAVLVTRGKSGMALLEKGRPPDLIAPHGSREAVDVTGAGDTVIATLALALAAGASLPLAARLANVAGALVVCKPGTATLGAEELLAELAG